MRTISIIGTGGMAAAIASNASLAGHTVEIVSRNLTKANKLAQEIGNGAIAGEFGIKPRGDIVILAVPYYAVLDLVIHYGEVLAGKILIDITNPVGPDLKSFLTPGDSCGSREIAKLVPADAHIVKAFNTQFSHVLAAGSFKEQPLDVFVAADNASAKSQVIAFIKSLNMRPLDVGSLSMARSLEHICLLSLGLMTHSVKNTHFAIGVSLTG
ncbi:NADP oxidoreductase [Pantoea rodasii]|uniref:NADP oxidoreductase n=1 Tax=Pantoea rodasii TaxID=1076549 RepID=A0A2M9WJ86_9GAMM|nr:NADPH-dependent F420 reductase [Pantoea rodasii]ORM61810.1 NADP oxidoreductase [Pantoea rodasii]PJZ07528.1 NADP oxidoreductase [Pantoea rodasii]